MIIIDNPKEKVPFDTLGNGDVFKYGDTFYMKTPIIWLASGTTFNVVSLSDGTPTKLYFNINVEPVNGRFILERN